MDFELLIGIFPQVLLDGLILGFMYALIALGYTMVYGVLEFINFAHSEIFIAGAFVGVEILLGLKSVGLLDGLPWPVVLLLALLGGMAASVAGPISPTAILIQRNDDPQMVPSSTNAPHSRIRMNRLPHRTALCLSGALLKSDLCHTWG